MSNSFLFRFIFFPLLLILSVQLRGIDSLRAEPLSGEWKLSTLKGREISDATVTLNFVSDFDIRGFDGCNSYWTSYRTVDDTITIVVGGGIATTYRGCDFYLRG